MRRSIYFKCRTVKKKNEALFSKSEIAFKAWDYFDSLRRFWQGERSLIGSDISYVGVSAMSTTVPLICFISPGTSNTSEDWWLVCLSQKRAPEASRIVLLIRVFVDFFSLFLLWIPKKSTLVESLFSWKENMSCRHIASFKPRSKSILLIDCVNQCSDLTFSISE